MIRHYKDEMLMLLQKPFVIGWLICIATISILNYQSGQPNRLFALYEGLQNGIAYANMQKAALWTLVNLPLSALIVMYLMADINHRIYVCLHRYLTYTQWWNKKYFTSLSFSIIYYCVSLILYGFFQSSALIEFDYIFKKVDFYILLLLVISGMFISALMTTVYVCTCNIQITAIIYFILIVGSISLGWFFPQFSSYLPGTWAMFARSSLYDSRYGFSIIGVIIIQMLLILAMYIIGRRNSKFMVGKIFE